MVHSLHLRWKKHELNNTDIYKYKMCHLYPKYGCYHAGEGFHAIMLLIYTHVELNKR